MRSSDANQLPFSWFIRACWLGGKHGKIAVNHVRSLCSPGTAITPLRRGGFSTFATTVNSMIGIIHSKENKA